MCPVTQQVKGYPFEVLLPKDAPIQGVVLSDQVKCLDWRAREAEARLDPAGGAGAGSIGQVEHAVEIKPACQFAECFLRIMVE